MSGGASRGSSHVARGGGRRGESACGSVRRGVVPVFEVDEGAVGSIVCSITEIAIAVVREEKSGCIRVLALWR